jgi:hypothetical protein
MSSSFSHHLESNSGMSITNHNVMFRTVREMVLDGKADLDMESPFLEYSQPSLMDHARNAR